MKGGTQDYVVKITEIDKLPIAVTFNGSIQPFYKKIDGNFSENV